MQQSNHSSLNAMLDAQSFCIKLSIFLHISVVCHPSGIEQVTYKMIHVHVLRNDNLPIFSNTG